MRGRSATIWMVLGIGLLVASGRAAEPIDIIPADSMLTWYGRPFPDAPQPGDGASPLRGWLDLARGVGGGALKPAARFNLRIFEFCGQMIRYPHALVLLDTSAKKTGGLPDAMQVDKLRLALIVQTRGASGPFALIVQNAIQELTSKEHAELEQREAHGFKYHHLHDKRLSEWSTFAWGDVGEFFVMAIGPDVFPTIAAVARRQELSLTQDSWYGQVRGERGRRASIEIFVGADEMRDRLDPLLHGNVTNFFATWGAADMRRAHWALGLEKQTLYCAAHFVLGDQTVERLYADAQTQDEDALRVVPAGARHAVYKLPAGDFLYRLVAGVYVWQPQRVQQQARQRWENIQRIHGFDAQKELLDHLGDTIILHNRPTHPLKLPIFFTTLIEIREQPEQVRQTLAKMCKTWQIALEKERKAAEQRGVDVDDPIQLFDDGDGVWYLQFGWIQGVAWKVTDRYIVVSYSPNALRSYLSQTPAASGPAAP